MLRLLARMRRFWETDRGLSVHLASLLLIGFAAGPLHHAGLAGTLLIAAFFSLMLVSGVIALARSRIAAVLCTGVAAASMVARVLSVTGPSWGRLLAASGTGCVVFAVLAALVLAQTFRQGPITTSRIVGGVVAYLLIGCMWGQGYHVLELVAPGSFRIGGDGVLTADDLGYFSFVTLTTAGYGDILPVRPTARSLAVIEALIGQLYPAILIARLVSLASERRGMQG